MIAGINSKDEPFIAASDVLGCLNFAKDFVVSGTAADKLFGMAEGLWEPDLVSCHSYHDTVKPTLIRSGPAADLLMLVFFKSWRSKGPEELFETVSQILLGALERDALSGWGAIVRIM